MKNMTFLLFFLILGLSVSDFTYAQDKPIPICTANEYDINNLTKATYWLHTQDGGCYGAPGTDQCTFYFTFCKPLQAAGGNCSGSSICQAASSEPNHLISLGKYKANPFLEKFDIGFIAAFPGGSNATDVDKQPCQLSTFFDFVCDTNANWPFSPYEGQPSPVPKKYFNVSYDSTACAYTMRATYAGACLEIVPATPDNGVLSAGTVLIIIFICLLVVYLGVGALYNGVIKKRRGVQLVPHHQLWFSVPSAAKDGVVATTSFVTCGLLCKGGAGKREYDDI